MSKPNKPAKIPPKPAPPPGGVFDEFGILRPVPPTTFESKGLAHMDEVNRKPIPPDLFRDGPGGFLMAPGSCGFSVNGNLLTGRKPLAGIPDGVPGQTVGLLNRPRPK
jgi:hypothetical protein